MEFSETSRYRAHEILSALKDHGPLTASVLAKTIKRPIRQKKLVRALDRLLVKGFIERRKVDQRHFYYFISQAPGARLAASKILGCGPDDLIQPLLKRKDWHHQELCEYWIFLVRKVFPSALIIRDRDIATHELASEVMLTSGDIYDVLPDFLLIVTDSTHCRKSSIAFEIERTRKSNARLIQKLRKYTHATRVDGLVYICDSGRLSDTIRLLYESVIRSNVNRAAHYGDFYFLFSDAIDTAINPLENIFNVRGEKVRLDDWVVTLLEIRETSRRNEMFTRRGKDTPSISN